MNVLVTGGAGFIGSHVAKVFAESGINVISLDRMECNNNDANTLSLKLDVNNLDALEETMLNRTVSTVVHFVGLPHVGECEKNPQLSFRLNTLSTQHVVEAMRKADVEKIVFASTASVYGYVAREKVSEEDTPKPDTIYGFHKLLSEEIIKSYQERYGIEFVILRLFNIYGGDPLHGKDVISLFIRRLREKKPLILAGPNKFRDFVHIDDVAKAFFKASINNVSDRYLNIGSGIKVTLSQLGTIFKSIAPSVEVIKEESPDDGTGFYADTTLARELLNFRAVHPLKGISEHIKQYMWRILEIDQVLIQDDRSIAKV